MTDFIAMKPAIALIPSLLAIALISPPAFAQQRVQDFTLPPGGTPTPTPTPEAAGPVDEAAGVAIPPRTIREPSPTPTPIPTPVPANVQPATITPTPAPVQSTTPSPSAAQPIVAPRPAPTNPLPSPTASASAPSASNQEPASEAITPSIALPTPEPIAPSQTTETPVLADATELPSWWAWAVGLVALLFAAGAGAWKFARKRAVAGPAPIEPPIVPSAGNGQANAVPIRADRLKTNIQVDNTMRSVMMLTLKFHVELANRQDRALRDVRVQADLISAKRDLPIDQQMASARSSLAELGQTDRIGPHQMGTLSGQLQLPLSEIEVFRQGQTPLCVPLLRLRIEAEGIEPQFHTFLIGLAALQPGGRLQPLPLSGPPGGIDGVQAKRLEA
ncbi:MAG: hypothetical protein HKM91_01495 [Altererythrobacter sp.]|nr:hypothetical protein [Altererythrobacter sp.]